MIQIYKYLVAVVLILMMSAEMSARHISEDEAYQKAAQFMGNRLMSRAMPDMNSPKTFGGCYVFNCEGGGFVIVSGSDKTDEILGYSKDGVFDVNDMPEGISNMLAGYNEEIDYAESNNITPVRSRTTDEYKEPVEPMCDPFNHWNQHYPYNKFCPVKDGIRTLTGCVATAFSQVLAYHKHDYQPTGLYTAINEKNEELSILLDTCVIDYNNFYPSYNSYLDDEEACNNVARLMKMCGYLVKMQYDTNGSAAYTKDIVDALTYLDYSNEAKYINRTDYETQNEWDSIIYNSLKENGPVIYQAKEDLYDGHCFVCDGYEDGYFHLNFGWEGKYNGYYKLNAIVFNDHYNFNPKDYEKYLIITHSAVINIKPNKSNSAAISEVYTDNNDYVSVYDISGKLIFTGNPQDISGLQRGIYIIRSRQAVRKVVVR